MKDEEVIDIDVVRDFEYKISKKRNDEEKLANVRIWVDVQIAHLKNEISDVTLEDLYELKSLIGDNKDGIL